MRRISKLALVGCFFCVALAGIPSALAAVTSVVDMQDSVFSPATLTVEVGDTVTFKNTGALPHTAQTKDGTFDTGNVSSGQSKDVVMKKAGTFSYFCLYHESTGMVGTIEVKGAPGAATPVETAPPDAAPTPDPASSPEAAAPPVAKPPTEKYFPIIGIGLIALMFGGIGMGFLKNLLKGIEARK